MYESRLALLHDALKRPSIVVRDAAVQRVAELNDAESIPHLQEARATGTCPQLREDIDAVLPNLREWIKTLFCSFEGCTTELFG